MIRSLLELACVFLQHIDAAVDIGIISGEACVTELVTLFAEHLAERIDIQVTE